jgi:hypothetical protein
VFFMAVGMAIDVRRLGAIRVTALAPEGTVSFGRVVLDFIAVDADRVDAIIAAAKADDYAVLREAIPRLPPHVSEVTNP